MSSSTLSKLAAIWVSPSDWYLSATGPKDTVACEIRSDHWARRPNFADPVKLVGWALSVADGRELPPPSTGRRIKFAKHHEDKVLRFALLLSPEACDAFRIGRNDGITHPWAGQFEAAGWKVRTKTVGPWLTIERSNVEIGILLVGWLDLSKPRELAGHGIVLGVNGHVDGWGSVFVHGEYRRLTGWPLSAGAGMAAVKALWRYPRTADVIWAPKPDYWESIAPLTFARQQRPWHVQWTTPTALPEPLPAGRVALWDANADYLTAWAAARFARGLLEHTGPRALDPDNPPDAGYYLISPITWGPDARRILDRLPPIWGSRIPNPDGTVWVTHVILHLIHTMRWERDYVPPAFEIIDSYTCADSGQIARPWGDKLKSALMFARLEADRTAEREYVTLAETLKQSYARGYPLMENGGFYRRPDHVDTLVDHRWQSAYRRMWKTAWDSERFPLDVSADEITYPWRDGDDRHGPLGAPHDYDFGRYKVKRWGTLQDWHQSHRDGRRGRWWLPAPEQAAGALQWAPGGPEAEGEDAGDWDWLDTARRQ